MLSNFQAHAIGNHIFKLDPNKLLIQDILRIQGGARTFLDNVYNIIIVLADRDAVLNHNEFLQPTICSSLMAMLLVQGLDSTGMDRLL